MEREVVVGDMQANGGYRDFIVQLRMAGMASETAFHTNQRSQDRSYIRMTDSPASRKAAAE